MIDCYCQLMQLLILLSSLAEPGLVFLQCSLGVLKMANRTTLSVVGKFKESYHVNPCAAPLSVRLYYTEYP